MTRPAEEIPARLTDAEEARYAELQQMALDHARAGETEPLRAMVLHGMPLNLADHKGNTLLMLAAYHGHAETAAMLLESGAEVDRRNARGQTPLGGAAFKGYEDVVELLLAHGADIDADNGMGLTPIMFAAMFGRMRVVAMLEKRAAKRGLMVRAIRWVSGIFLPRPRPSSDE